jgi:hypothetical protein
VPVTDGADAVTDGAVSIAGAASLAGGAKLFCPVKRRRLVSENSFSRFKVGVWSV